MAKKVFAVYLAKEDVPNSEAYATLELPASPWELWDAMEKVRLKDGEALYMEIDDYYAFEYLAPHLEELDISLNELNDLAARLATLDEVQGIAFEGLFSMEVQKKVNTNGGIITMQDIFKTIRAGIEIVVDDLKWSFDKKVIPKSKATWLTVLTALLGATLGAAFGGITGGVIGLSLGVLLGLYLVGLDPETWKTEMDAEDAWIVVITALLGALLGSVFLGITGGVAGFSLGAILGLYLTGFAEGDEEHGGKSQLLSELIVVLCALLGAVIGSIVTPGVGTVVGMGLGLILGLSIYSVRKDPKKGTQRLVSIGRSVLLGLLAGVLGVGLAALGIVSAGTAFIISAAIGLALKFFVDSVDDSKVRKATSGFTGTRVSTKAPTRRRRVAAQSLDGNAPVYNDIPQLAHGAVIPPNKEFLAVLGDQKSGTNIETPLATMVDAFKQAMAESGGGATTVVIQLDGKEIARSTVKNINNMTRAAGKPVLLY